MPLREGRGCHQGHGAPRHPPRPRGAPRDPRSPALQSSHPGHLPGPGAGSGAILHDFISLPSNFSAMRQQGLDHPRAGCPQGGGERRWAVPRRRGGSVAAAIGSGDKFLRGGGTSAHLHPEHPPALPGLEPGITRGSPPCGAPRFVGWGTQAMPAAPAPQQPRSQRLRVPDPRAAEPLATGAGCRCLPCPAAAE